MASTVTNIARSHLILSLADGVGPIVFTKMLAHFGDAERALGASASQLQAVDGIGRVTADGIARSRDVAQADAEIAAAAEHGVRIVCRADPDYPEPLLRIADPPIVLYVRGELRPTDAVAIAIVGSRRCSIYGSEQARRFGELVAQAGFTVVSGLARGIDSFAHHGAIDAGGRSIAVFGNGLGEVYPPENRALAEKLLEHGAWVSELPMRASVRGSNFLPRNRIIAGLSLGTLVVEAAARSGALSTAKCTSEYNRELFAIPGRVQDPTSFGTNALIRDGAAKLVMTLDDILNELGEVGRTMRAGLRPTIDAPEAVATDASVSPEPSLFHSATATPAGAASLSRTEERVYQVVGREPMLQDIIMAAAELPPGEVIAAFTGLELKGLIKRLPGQLVVRRGSA